MSTPNNSEGNPLDASRPAGSSMDASAGSERNGSLRFPLALVWAEQLRRPWVKYAALGTLALVVVVAASFVYGLIVAQAPIEATQQFCTSLQKQDYKSAYGRLSPRYQRDVPLNQFALLSQLHDKLDGPITNCGLPHRPAGTFSFNLGTTATLSVQFTRHKAYSGHITLVSEGGKWTIDQIGTSVLGTDFTPLTLTRTFCEALASKHYQTAYNLFTSRYQQQQGSEAAFAKAFDYPDIKLAGCTPMYTSYIIATNGDSATLDLALNVAIQTATGYTTVDVPATVIFAKDGAWKIANINVKSP